MTFGTGTASTIMASKKDYEDYQEASQDYDSTRVVCGVEVLLGAFSYGTKRPLKDLHVLDAGCGTGNYLVALSGFVGKVTGLELNKGMLEKAKEKTAHLDNVEVLQGDVTNMPFPDSQFDAICCNMVIHHLDPPGSSGHPMIKKFAREAYRVLKTGGATLVINTHTPEQCKSPWYFTLLPSAQKKMAEKVPTSSEVEAYLAEVGFTPGPTTVLTELLFKPAHWHNKEGPLSKEWRNTVSVFALATPEELEEALTKWRKCIDDGTADQVLEQSEELRQTIGLSTSVVGYKC